MNYEEVREPLPDRRRTFTHEVRIDGEVCVLSLGEYGDGRLGEIWLEMPHSDTVTAGILGTLCRTVSMLLQDGAPVATIVRSLRGINYPPQGPVIGSQATRQCMSVTDWAAAEIEARYVTNGRTTQAA